MKEIFLLPDNETVQLSEVFAIGDITLSGNHTQNIIGFTISFKNGIVKNIFLKFTKLNKLKTKREIQIVYNNLIEAINEFN